VAKQWFVLKQASVSAKHAEEIWRSLEKDILPSIENVPAQDIKARLLIQVLEPIKARGALETVRRIGNANITPANPRKYLYHAYLSYMEARGHKYLLNLTVFGRAVPQTLREYEIALLKRRTNQGMQTNLILSEDCEADWLPKCEMR